MPVDAQRNRGKDVEINVLRGKSPDRLEKPIPDMPDLVRRVLFACRRPRLSPSPASAEIRVYFGLFSSGFVFFFFNRTMFRALMLVIALAQCKIYCLLYYYYKIIWLYKTRKDIGESSNWRRHKSNSPLYIYLLSCYIDVDEISWPHYLLKQRRRTSRQIWYISGLSTIRLGNRLSQSC